MSDHRLVAALAALLTACGTLSVGGLANAQSISVYGGYQTAPHSGVDVSDGLHFTAGWEGKSFVMPPYYGLRGTWWLDDVGMPNVGLTIDFSHTKVYADAETMASTPGWTRFEFTDGLNVLTANVLYKFEPLDAWTPYVGGGFGVVLPHVEVTRPSGETFGSQYGGPAAQLQAGVDYRITENWSAFVEYKFNYAMVDVAIDSGARLQTNIITNALNVGISYHF